MPHIIFDCEIIGSKKPVFLIGTKVIETGKTCAFWGHKENDRKTFSKYLKENHTWIGFNSENFDRPLIAAWLDGFDVKDIKNIATRIIHDEMRSWQTYKEFGIKFREYDHIDLFDVAPGVQISLKTYAGRMGFKTMVDMPFHHDKDLTAAEIKTLEKYCINDLNVTEELYKQLSTEMDLRRQLTKEYDLDLRSKSDAQIAESILKSKCGIQRGDKYIPSSVRYTCPSFITSSHLGIKEVIDLLNAHKFKLNHMSGQPEVPDFLKEPLRINNGYYQMGVGGLHSTHDQKIYLEASDNLLLSDFDVTSYYPNIMMKCGLVPRLGGNKGKLFIEEYRRIYEQRMEAKRSGNKKVANSLKITLNGTFGKLGNLHCSFYSPDLMLAVTITGQLNLLCLIHELEKIKGVTVRSANTDGVLVAYPPSTRTRVLNVFTKNAKRTGFEYEETQYLKYAAKDVNNYFAVKKAQDKNGTWLNEPASVKRKGLYAVSGVQEMKNPTMQVCSDAVANWLETEMSIAAYIEECNDLAKFVEIRGVKGGGFQPEKYIDIDDWICTKDLDSAKSEWMRQKWINNPDNERVPVKRKSRPAPVQEGVGGIHFGRVARWYMTTTKMPALHYVGSGNKVPMTEGAKLCMTLATSVPKDINREWYINEAMKILTDCGIALA